MHCPECQHDHTRVLETRLSGSGLEVRRRRECMQCGERMTTYERPEAPALLVRKRTTAEDGSARVEDFCRAKLLDGLARACSRSDVGSERLEALAIEIEQQLRAAGSRQVASERIGELSIEGLRGLDEHAAQLFEMAFSYSRTRRPDAAPREELRDEMTTAAGAGLGGG